MDFVKRENPSVTHQENYKAFMDNLQKSHQIEALEYQHTPISMEQLQAMQSSLNTSNILHNFQLPLSPRQMSTLMLKTNLPRNFTEIPAHLSRNLELDLSHSLANELPQNLRHDDILSQNLNRNIDLSLVRSLGNEIDLQNNLAHSLAQNISEDLRINGMNDIHLAQNLRPELAHDLNHEIDLSHHINRQNIEQEILNEKRTPMVIQCVPDAHLLEQNLQRIDQSLAQRLDHSIQRLEQNIGHRIDQNINQHLDQNVVQRLDQSVMDRLDQAVMQRLDHSVVQRLDQASQRLDQRLVNELTNRQLSQNDHMQFHIKSEQEDDGYFYDNINQGMGNVEGINGHLQGDHTQSTQSTIQPETQMYSGYSPHIQPNIPALNPIDLYSRNPNFAQNYVSRENPQNLVVHRQFDNSSPYQEDFKKLRQDGVENGAKTKNEEPKENLKPSDENKIFNEFSHDKNDDSSKLHEELSMNIKGEYVCYKCNEIFPSKRGLKQHAKSCIESEESSEKVGKFSCSQCAYRCQSTAILKIHERTHSGEKPFSCNFCDYKSGQKNNVAKHILVHMKEKPFRCQYCDYRCAQKNNLVVHERTHTGYKPFACPYCEYRTVQKPNLVKHMYLHTDQKPFSCDMCNYRCVQKTNLTKHKQRHLNDKDVVVVRDQKPYRPRQKSVKCTVCSYRCVQQSSMVKHMQFKHAGIGVSGEVFDENPCSKLSVLMKNDDDVQNLSVKKEKAVFSTTVLEESMQVQS